MSCERNPLTGRKRCDEAREAAKAKAAATVKSIAAGDIVGAARNARATAAEIANGAAIMARNSGHTIIGGRWFKTGSANRRDDTNG